MVPPYYPLSEGYWYVNLIFICKTGIYIRWTLEKLTKCELAIGGLYSDQ
jgi:hypothetical protein